MTLVNTETGELVEPLTAMERSALTHAEAEIERGLTSFVEVGEALTKVRDERLYRTEFGTFKAYCRERWGLGESRVYQLMDAAAVTSTIVEPDLRPVNEGQARALAGLPADAVTDVMREAHEATGGKVTAAAIRDARPDAKTPEPALSGEVDADSGQSPEGEVAPGDMPPLVEHRASRPPVVEEPSTDVEKFLEADGDLADQRFALAFHNSAGKAGDVLTFKEHEARIVELLDRGVGVFGLGGFDAVRRQVRSAADFLDSIDNQRNRGLRRIK